MLVAAAVAANELHRGSGHGDVEEAGVGGVGEVEAHDLAGRGLQLEAQFARRQHHVAEATHRDVGGTLDVERGDPPVFD